MAEFSNGAWIGNFNVAIDGWPTLATDSRYDRLKRYDPALGSARHHDMHATPASFYQIDLYVITTANNNTVNSCDFSAPWPFKILAADVGCETAASDAGTVNILIDPAGGTSYVTILDAAEDVKTGAGVGQRVAPEVDSEDVAYDASIRIAQVASTAANMIGGQAHLYVQRL